MGLLTRLFPKPPPLLRWRFPDEREAAERSLETARMDAWWREFAAHADDIERFFARPDNWDAVGWTDRHFRALSPKLCWEYGPGIRGKRRLAVTPEVAHALRPMVHELIRRAPPELGWDFLEGRPPEPLDKVSISMQQRFGVALSELTASAKSAEHGFVDVTLFSEKPTGAHHRAGFYGLEGLVGEDVMNTWIGSIDVQRGEGEPIAALKGSVQQLIDARIAKLPQTPWVDRRTGFSICQLRSPRLKDCAAQDDLLIATTSDLDRLKNAQRGMRFDSRRYSKHGELLCYLKIDGREGLTPGGFADKAQIENALDGALRSARLGCCIGGGTGNRYSYVDMALLEPDAAIPRVVAAMREGKLPKRSWILFFDTALAAEWVGIWPDSPAPMLLKV